MGETIVSAFCMIVALAMLIVNVYSIKNASGERGIGRKLFHIVMAVILLFCSGLVLTYDNNLLWFGQRYSDAQIEMNVSSDNAEDTSFLYILAQIDSKTTPADIENLLGSDYVLRTDHDYTMVYESPDYTLAGYHADSIAFKFNKKGTMILTATWGKAGTVSSGLAKGMTIPLGGTFSDIRNYLESDVLGSAKRKESNKVDWTGFHLENIVNLLFQRVF